MKRAGCGRLPEDRLMCNSGTELLSCLSVSCTHARKFSIVSDASICSGEEFLLHFSIVLSCFSQEFLSQSSMSVVLVTLPPPPPPFLLFLTPLLLLVTGLNDEFLSVHAFVLLSGFKSVRSFSYTPGAKFTE